MSISTVISNAPLISISNALSCATLYRSQGTPLGVPSDKPLAMPSIALKNASSSVP